MKLKLTRSQKTTGAVSKSVVFMLDAQVEMTEEEMRNVNQYKLGKEVVYNSEKSKEHLAKVQEASEQSGGGTVKALASLAAAKMSLNITINDLINGKHIECKELAELQGAEEAIMNACRMLRSYLDTAATFDGREEVIEFESQTAPAA